MHNQCEPSRVRESEITNQMGQLEKTIDVARETIDALRAKISPVLRPSVIREREPEKDYETLAPLANMIQQCRYKVAKCNQDLQVIIEECEL